MCGCPQTPAGIQTRTKAGTPLSSASGRLPRSPAHWGQSRARHGAFLPASVLHPARCPSWPTQPRASLHGAAPRTVLAHSCKSQEVGAHRVASGKDPVAPAALSRLLTGPRAQSLLLILPHDSWPSRPPEGPASTACASQKGKGRGCHLQPPAGSLGSHPDSAGPQSSHL